MLRALSVVLIWRELGINKRSQGPITRVAVNPQQK